jgi:predicted RNase H-like nuclease (RuvC/YqgF family)
MSLKDRLKRIEHKVSINNVIPDDGRVTLKITGETTGDTIQNALRTVREAKQNGIEHFWLQFSVSKNVDMGQVAVALVKELSNDETALIQ